MSQQDPQFQTDNPLSAPILTTMPDEILRHSISDEELTMLEDRAKDTLHDALYAAVAGVVGAAASAISALWSYCRDMKHYVFAPTDLLQCFIFFGALGIAIVVGLICYGRSKRPSLVEKIRNRTPRPGATTPAA